MSASNAIGELVGKARTSENEAKIDAITKLQQAFEADEEINDVDTVISTLKTSLRTPNQHLTTATLNAINALVLRIFPLHQPPSSPSGSSIASDASVDSHITNNLRQALVVFLPTPGIIDRLGEAREASRKAAKQALVSLGLAAVTYGDLAPRKPVQKGRPSETPVVIFESYFKEAGFGSKVARVRQQSLLTLVQLRQDNHQFPMRPYLTSIVNLLEDSDGSVRDSARQSTITLFSAASEGARTDLKREMTKKGVRKAIVDGILFGLLSSSTNPGSFTPTGSSRSQSEFSGSEVGAERTPITASVSTFVSSVTTIPPAPTPVSRSVSGPSRLVSSRELGRGGAETPIGDELIPPTTFVITPVFIASARDLEDEFAKMASHFEGKETEHNWAPRDHSINRIRGMIKGDAHLKYETTFLSCLRGGMLENSFKTVASLRTTVASNTCHLYNELSAAFGPLFDPFVDSVLKQLLKMSGFTKKIIAKESQASVNAIIAHTSAQPRIVLPLLHSFVQDKNVQTRQYVIGHIKHYIEVHGQPTQTAIESHGGLELLDGLIRKGLQDINPSVKANAREAFWSFDSVWHSQAWSILSTMDPQGRKQLEKANPNPDSRTPTLEHTPIPPKKSSVAAAIAASKAKAKAIASAPPTLRHAATSNATSASHKTVSPSTSGSTPLSRRAATPTRTSPGPPSLLRRQSASPVPPSAKPSPPSSRPVPVVLTPPPNTNSQRRICTSPSPPTSPTSELTMRRRAVSPLAGTMSPPRSPPNRSLHITPPVTPQNFIQHLLPPGRRTRVLSTPLSRLQGANVPRDSIDMLANIENDDSLLMAIQNPLPQDSDSDPEDVRATETETRPRTLPEEPSRPDTATDLTCSPAESTSPTLYPGDSVSQSASITLPPAVGTPTHDFMMEDAIRATAEQAESSADRLNELMDDAPSMPLVPPHLLPGPAASPELRRTQSGSTQKPPVTPAPRQADGKGKLMSLFQNSPAVKGSPSIMDRLYEKKHESGWWLKRKSLLANGTPLKADQSTHEQELRLHIKALVDGTANVRTLQKLALLCNAHPALGTDEEHLIGEPSSPTVIRGSHRTLESDLWHGGRMFDAVFKPLVRFVTNTKDVELIEYGLCVFLEMVENQVQYIDESRLVLLLFHVRNANTHPILEATNTIRDALVSSQEPVWGLKSFHGCLLAYLAEPLPSWSPPGVASSVRTSSHAFGIIGIGKLILRLPAEVLEDELPLLKSTLLSVLDSGDPSSTIVRESAYATIVAAQSILRKEVKLFSLLDGIEISKKNLLTYYFDKHGVRGPIEGVPASERAKESGVDEKVVRELLRLDNKTSTPVKSG